MESDCGMKSFIFGYPLINDVKHKQWLPQCGLNRNFIVKLCKSRNYHARHPNSKPTPPSDEGK